jgi:NAD(P)-dependent dehydrogenase (short-subunit alcohol dehydrogenase family)
MKRTMLITGATGGIGAAIVQAAARDYRVFATGRDAAALRALPADPVPVDLRTPGDLAGALPHLDHLDALVHCAGIADVASVEETPHEQWTDTLTVNVVAAADLAAHRGNPPRRPRDHRLPRRHRNRPTGKGPSPVRPPLRPRRSPSDPRPWPPLY